MPHAQTFRASGVPHRSPVPQLRKLSSRRPSSAVRAEVGRSQPLGLSTSEIFSARAAEGRHAHPSVNCVLAMVGCP